MKNLAIIIGVTDYTDPELVLPGCKNDVLVMETILRASGRFEVHTLPSNDGEVIKDQLSDVVNRYLHEPIDQLLFYFTGHGDYLNDDFRFLFRDYTNLRSAQTSLASKDLDHMLRGLQPRLAVKVIDACHSGLNYVKSSTGVHQDLGEGMRATFSNCYFMFSSEGDQKSYADRNMSNFTTAFAKSISEAKIDDVRYRYIIDFVTDAFSDQESQRPYFVSQGPLTELLGKFDVDAKSRIRELLAKANVDHENMITGALPDLSSETDLSVQTEQEMAVPPPRFLAELAKQQAASYVTQDHANAVIAELRESLSLYVLNPDLEEIYTAEYEFFDTYPDIPNERLIGAWLERNKFDEYFAEPTYRTEIYDAPPQMSGSNLDFMMAQLNLPTKKTRKVLSGLTSSLQGAPFQTFCLTLKPKLLNLVQYRLWLTILISKTMIQVFYAPVEYKEVAWGKYEESEFPNWTRIPHNLTESRNITKVASIVLQEFDEWAIVKLKKRLSVV